MAGALDSRGAGCQSCSGDGAFIWLCRL